MSPKQRFNMYLEASQIDALKAIEVATGAKPSEQIRRAVDRWIEENKPAAVSRRGGRGRARALVAGR